MINNDLIDNFKANESICDIDVLKKIINVLDYDTVLELQRLYYDSGYYYYSLNESGKNLSEDERTLYEIDYEITTSLEKQLKHLKYVRMPFHENETLDQLLAWFNDSQSRKVDYARRCLQKRFQYLSFDDQHRIIEAFLNKGNMSDTFYCCDLFKNDAFWQDRYLPFIESFFVESMAKKPNIAYKSGKFIIKHFSKEFILSCINVLDVPDVSENVRFILQLLLHAIDEHPYDVLKNVILRPDEYVYIMAKKGLKVTESEAAQALNLLLDLELDGNKYNKNRIKIKTITWSVARMGYFELLFDVGAKLKAKYSVPKKESYRHNYDKDDDEYEFELLISSNRIL